MPAEDVLHVELKSRAPTSRHGAGFSLDVAFDVPPGITILFGPSGSGKSTTLGAIAGLSRPDEGRITLGDEVWLDSRRGVHRPVHKRGVAFVFQSLALFPHMSAVGNVIYGMDRALDGHAKRRRALEILERLRVPHLADRKPPTFSGGEAQRVALARAFAMSPRVVLLDEPFSAMDRELRKDLAMDVRSFVDDLQVPLLHVTHHRNEARAIGDRVLFLDGGRLVKVGTVDDLFPGEHSGEPRDMSFDDTPMPRQVKEELEKP